MEQLATTETPVGLCNQYAGAGPAAIRRANLRLYLAEMARRCPRVLLVGEAAGHRGCRLTGVPFTSEALLLEGIEAHNLFGRMRGYRKTAERERIVGEATATIVWGVLSEFKCLPLLWNALPFHPFRDNDYWSNRTPRRTELALGEPFLQHLVADFRIETVVAVGRKASASLDQCAIPAQTVRHPSHGGKRAFRDGLKQLLL